MRGRRKKLVNNPVKDVSSNLGYTSGGIGLTKTPGYKALRAIVVIHTTYYDDGTKTEVIDSPGFYVPINKDE